MLVLVGQYLLEVFHVGVVEAPLDRSDLPLPVGGLNGVDPADVQGAVGVLHRDLPSLPPEPALEDFDVIEGLRQVAEMGQQRLVGCLEGSGGLRVLGLQGQGGGQRAAGVVVEHHRRLVDGSDKRLGREVQPVIDPPLAEGSRQLDGDRGGRVVSK